MWDTKKVPYVLSSGKGLLQCHHLIIYVFFFLQ